MTLSKLCSKWPGSFSKAKGQKVLEIGFGDTSWCSMSFVLTFQCYNTCLGQDPHVDCRPRCEC